MSANAQMVCDTLDEAGRTVVFVFLVAGGVVAAVVTAALFLGYAIRRTVRLLIRRHAEGRF